MACLVSVIIPAYNVGNYVKEALASVLEQTYSNIEVIVVDDCSTDHTVAVVEGFKDSRLKLIRNQANGGVSFSRNRAIEAASGDWIAVCDSDDWWSPDRLEKLMAYAEANNAQIVCDDLWLIREGDEKPHTTYLKSRIKVIGELNEPVLFSAAKMIKNDFGYLKPIVRSDLIKRYGLQYDVNWSVYEDLKFLLGCVYRSGRMLLVPEPTYFYLMRANSLSSSDTLKKTIQIFRTQVHYTEELLRDYRDERSIVKSLKGLLEKKKTGLIEFLINENLENRKFLKALSVMVMRPRTIKSLLRKALAK